MSLALPTDLRALVGATIERVDTPTYDLVTFALRDVERDGGLRRTTLVLAAGATLRGIGLVDRRPRGGAPATSFCMLLRKHLVGARIERVRASERAIELVLSADGARRTIELDAHGRPGDVILRSEDDSIVGSLRSRRVDPPPIRDALEAPAAAATVTLEQEGARLLSAAALDDLAGRKREIVQALGRTLTRLRRRSAAIAADLVRLDGADELRRVATLLAPIVSRVPSGATSVRVTDWSSDPPREIDLPLDPSRAARAQVDAMFRRARGFDRGRSIAAARAAATDAEIVATEALLARASTATDRTILDALASEAARTGALPTAIVAPAPGRRPAPQSRKPYRAFRGAGQRIVLVGKTAAANDELTLRVARPHDLWLHVRDYAGSHVVVPLERGRSCPSELLVDAAHLAAHFSGARGNERVEVSYVERRYVRKPRGSAVGAVQLDRERVILLACDAERLAALLASELPD